MSDRLNMELADSEERPGPASPLRVVSHGGGGAPAFRHGSPANGSHLTDYLKVLYKRRWTSVTAFVVVLLSVTVYTFSATPVFESRTRVLIEIENPNVISFKQVVDENQRAADYYQTQYNILQSRALARKTLTALKLWSHPAFGGGAAAAPVPAVKSWWQVWKRETPLVPAQADETIAESRAIDIFLAGLTVSPIRNSRLVDLKYRSPDPVLATDVVNTLARAYIEQSLEYKFLTSKEANDWLSEQLAEQRKSVEKAELALQRYREQNDAIPLQDRENIVIQKLADLNAAQTRAKTERIQKEAMYRQLQQAQANPAMLDTFPAILSNSFIQQQKSDLAALQRQYAALGEKLLDKHPDMEKLKTQITLSQTKLNTEINKVVQSVRSEYEAAVAQEQTLTGALNAQKADVQAANRKALEYSTLERDVQSGRQLYDTLMQRAKETGVSTELRTSNIRVVDPAERPRTPASPRVAMQMSMGVFGGALFALGLAFFFEYLDSRVRTPEQITNHLGMSVLGIVPLATSSTGGGEPLLSGGVPPNYAEALRALRTNVLFSSAEEGARSLLVTSTGPGEGKTMIATNLAISFAQSGQRVLLIDADMRRPRLHAVLSQKQEPGLSNLLVGTSKASETVRKTDTSGLWVMASGRIPPNPAELLGSVRFRDFLASLSQHFDWIVIDSPPVMAVTDAAIISNIVNSVVYVVGAEMTAYQAAQTGIEQLHRARARIIGAVLNRVDLERNAYYYSNYYRREYGAYYQKA